MPRSNRLSKDEKELNMIIGWVEEAEADDALRAKNGSTRSRARSKEPEEQANEEGLDILIDKTISNQQIADEINARWAKVDNYFEKIVSKVRNNKS